MLPNGLTRRWDETLRAIEIRWRVSGYLAPSANEPLSETEFDRATALCSDVRALVAARAGYIAENGLDAEFCLPGAHWGGNWEERTRYRGTVALLRGDYEIINNLRLFSQVFSGYSLVELKDARGVPVPDRVAPGLEERHLLISRRKDEWVQRYWAVSRCVSDALHLS